MTPVLSLSGSCNLEMSSPAPAIAALKSPVNTKSSKLFAKNSSIKMINSSLGKTSALKEMPASVVVHSANLQSNLFQAGFEDCASEVMRFLVQQEKINNSDPMIQGLQSHLRKMSNVICEENISDVDQFLQHSPSKSTDSTRQTLEVSDIKDLINTQTSDADVIPSQSSDLELDSERLQNVHHYSPPQSLLLKRKRPAEFSTDLSCSSSSSSSSFLSLCHLPAPTVCSSAKRQCQKQRDDTFSDTTGVECVEPSSPVSVSSASHIPSDALTCHSPLVTFYEHLSSSSISPFLAQASSTLPGLCFPYYPLGQSSPLPSSSSSSLSSSVYSHLNYSSPSSSSSAASSASSSSSSSASSSASSSSSLGSAAPLVSENLPENQTESTTSPTAPTTASDNLNSILELKANFLPGIDTSSLASGNFADILLAVESCQSHDNPRVRELADRIINLVHHDDDEEDYDDDEEEEEYNDEETDGIVSDTVHHDIRRGSQLEDSGVDLGDDGVDWCNPADMIEL